MDGVIADFDKAYNEYLEGKPDNSETFRKAVTEYEIFTKLDRTPWFNDLIRALKQFEYLYDMKILILSSVGTNRAYEGGEAAKQKERWLLENGIPWKSIFVAGGTLKGDFGNVNSVLIDDTSRCVEPFIKNGGKGILFTGDRVNEIIEELNQYLLDNINNGYILYGKSGNFKQPS